MTDLVSLIFVTMIPVDCKITIFFLYLLQLQLQLKLQEHLYMHEYCIRKTAILEYFNWTLTQHDKEHVFFCATD